MKEKEILLLLRNDKLTENDKKILEMYIAYLRQTNDIYRKDIEALKNNYNDLIKMCENKFRKIQHCYCSRTDCGFTNIEQLSIAYNDYKSKKDKATTLYLKELSEKGKVDDLACKMFNALEGNK